MGKVLSTVLGGGSEPRVSPAAVESTEEKKAKAKKARAQVFGTSGGVAGEELEIGQVGGTDNLFGN